MSNESQTQKKRNVASETREKLIQAGLEELTEVGVHAFSTRNVARRCGVSCATPYKHFKDTHAFIAEILGYINKLYYARQEVILREYANCSNKRQLLEISLDYIRFLTEYPQFRQVMMQNFKDCDEEYRCLRGQLSLKTYEAVSRYCEEVHMPPDLRHRKTVICRSIIYGAAILFGNAEMEYNDENMQMVADMLDREFELN